MHLRVVLPLVALLALPGLAAGYGPTSRAYANGEFGAEACWRAYSTCFPTSWSAAETMTIYVSDERYTPGVGYAHVTGFYSFTRDDGAQCVSYGYGGGYGGSLVTFGGCGFFCDRVTVKSHPYLYADLQVWLYDAATAYALGSSRVYSGTTCGPVAAAFDPTSGTVTVATVPYGG